MSSVPPPRDALAEGEVAVVTPPPVWGMPSTTPFGSKLLTWLRMAGIPYRVVPLTGPPRSGTGKVPYLLLPDGGTLADSGVIIDTLTAARGVRLDDGRSPEQRAIAHAIRRVCEESLYFALAWDRWEPDDRFAAVRAAYLPMVPAALRAPVAWHLRRQMRAVLHGQGVGRMAPEVIVGRAREDLHALDALLGDREWVSDRPGCADCILYAFVGGLLSMPVPSPIRALGSEVPRLVAHVERVRAAYWSDSPPPPVEG